MHRVGSHRLPFSEVYFFTHSNCNVWEIYSRSWELLQSTDLKNWKRSPSEVLEIFGIKNLTFWIWSGFFEVGIKKILPQLQRRIFFIWDGIFFFSRICENGDFKSHRSCFEDRQLWNIKKYAVPSSFEKLNQTYNTWQDWETFKWFFLSLWRIASLGVWSKMYLALVRPLKMKVRASTGGPHRILSCRWLLLSSNLVKPLYKST